MKFKIIDEVDDTPILPYRPSVTEQIHRKIAEGEELKDLMKKHGKEKDDKKDEKKGLTGKQVALWLFITWLPVGWLATEFLIRIKQNLLILAH